MAAPDPDPAAGPVPMKLFAAWEMERCCPSCVPRLCSLTLTRLMVLKALDKEMSSVVIAVKMQGSKRTLRSNEYLLPPGGLMETELELSFSLQYPHFLKRDVNRLLVMLQRRKRHKNRTILGYKTLAVGVIDMAEVLQRPTHRTHLLSLRSSLRDVSMCAAELSVRSLSSLPVHQEDTRGHHGNRTKASDHSYQENYGQDDNDSFSSEQEESDDACPLQVLDSGDRGAGEDLDLLCDSGPEDSDSIQNTAKPKLRPFFEEVSRSASQTEIGSLSGQKSQQEEGAAAGTELLSSECLRAQGAQFPNETKGEVEDSVATGTDAGRAAKLCKTESQTHLTPSETGSQLSRYPWTVSIKDRQNLRLTGRSSSVESETSTDSRMPPPQEARKSVLDQLNHILFSDDQIPDSIILINIRDWQGQYLAELLFDQPIVCTVSSADVQAAFSAAISRIQRFCNCNSQTPPILKVVVGGDQSYLSTVLCCFVEQLASKTSDWLSYVRFLVLPVAAHPLAKYLAALDSKFNALFMDSGWKELFGRVESPSLDLSDPLGVAARVSQYLSGAAVSHLCPISEAMLTCKHKSPLEDSYQKFVPFIGVRHLN